MKKKVIKKTIAIVGATENKGIEIAGALAQNGYRLLLISNDAGKLSVLSERITASSPDAEVDVLKCVKDGCWEADVIVLAVAGSEEKLVAGLMKEVATQKIVVSISDEKKLNEDLLQVLPYSKLVNVFFTSLSNEIAISGNDKDASDEVAGIFENAGYRVEQVHYVSEHK